MVKFINARVKLHGSCWFNTAAVANTPLYWKSVDSSTDWFSTTNWFLDSGGNTPAQRVATTTDNVYVIGSIRPIANIVNNNWVNPNSINVGTLGMGLSSLTPFTVATNFRGTGTVSVSGRVTIDDPTQ